MLQKIKEAREAAQQELRGLPPMPDFVRRSKDARLVERKMYLENVIRDLDHFIESWEWNLEDERNGVENMR